MNDGVVQKKLKDNDYFLFLGTDEKIVFETTGILNNTVNGNLVLTDKRLFFYFVSNISRDKIFIATYPYIISVKLREGLTGSALTIKNKKESFEIKKINKKEARNFYGILNRIASENIR